jgi:nitrogen regulatory protein P-II 2
MQFVIAIIKPLKLDDVLEALAVIGVQGVTVTETKDYALQQNSNSIRGSNSSNSNVYGRCTYEIPIGMYIQRV